LTVALLVAGRAEAQVRKGDRYTDARFGFQVKTPKGWTSLPSPSGQSWVIGRYLSDKTYFYTESGGGWTYDFKPELTIIAFVAEDLKKAARKAKEKEAEKGYVPERIELESAYRDYPDFLAKTYSGGGFYFSREEVIEVGELSVTVYEAKVEKLTRSGPKRIVTWLYALQDVDVALQFEVLEDDYDDISKLLEKTLRGLKVIPREGEMPILQGQVGSMFVSIELIEKMTPEERRSIRMTQQEQAHRDAVQGLGDEWHTAKIGRFLVISKADEKYDKRIADQACAVFDWLEQTFPYVGAGEYVREPIIRICKDSDEEWSFRGAGGHDFRGDGLEITTNKEYGGARSSEFEYLNQRVAEIWFRDRDRELWWAMPSWLAQGLRGVIGEATAKKGKLDFYRDAWTMEQMRELIRNETATEPLTLVYLTDAAFMSQEGAGIWGRRSEAKLFVEYLLVGAGAKRGDSKDIVENYIRNLDRLIDEIDAKEEESDDSPPPKTEEEEEARLKAQREQWKQREEQLLDELGRRTFVEWTQQNWSNLSRNYFKSI
jgi:hypothetical protein